MDDWPLKGYTTSMIDLGKYIFKYLNTSKITPEESFTDAYVEKENYESETFLYLYKKNHM